MDPVRREIQQRSTGPAQALLEQRQVTPGARREAVGAEANRRVTFTIDATQHFQ